MSKTYSVLHPFSFMPNLKDKTEKDISKIYTYLKEGKGSWVTDDKGKKYFYATTAVPAVGLGNQRIIHAINKQLNKLSFGSTCGQSHELLQLLTEKLIKLTENQFSLAFYTNDGSGAVEAAMKLVRQYFNSINKREKNYFISLDGNYHGTTIASGSVTHMGIKESFGVEIPGCYSAPFPNMYRPPINGKEDEIVDYCIQELLKTIEEIGPEKTAAILVEPIQGVNGIIPINKKYLKEVEKIAKENEILLIADEVTTGLGRTGYWIASEYYGIKPDMLTISKGLTGGYFPMGVTLMNEKVENIILKEGGIFLHGATQCGHPVGCAAALELISIIEDENLLDNAKELGTIIKTNLQQKLSDIPKVGDIRGQGMMISIEMADGLSKEPISFEEGETLSEELKNQGILGNYFNSILLLYPPLNTSLEDANFIVEKVTKAFKNTFKSNKERMF